MKVIALDIETANLDMDAEGLAFDNPKGWQTSVVCVYDSHKDKNYIFVGDADYAPAVRKCGGKVGLVYQFDFLHHFLQKWKYDGYLLLTHNGEGFDFPIMSKSVSDGGVGNCKEILEDWPSSQKFDSSLYLKQKTGIRYRLNHLIHGMLGEDQSKLMDAANAPIEWAKGNHEEVIRYCVDDCLKTYNVLIASLDSGYFTAIGKDEYIPVEAPSYYNGRLC